LGIVVSWTELGSLLVLKKIPVRDTWRIQVVVGGADPMFPQSEAAGRHALRNHVNI